MNTKKWGVAVLISSVLGIVPTVYAHPEFVQPAGAAGCTDCHIMGLEEGVEITLGYHPGVLEAFKGGMPGLKAFITKLHCKQDPSAAECKPPKNNTPPVLLPIKAQWDVTVGEEALVIPLMVNDKEDDMFAVTLAQPSTSPKANGALFSAERTDMASRLPAIDFKWKPTPAQANKTYVVNFTVREKGAGRTESSKPATATITVWPARTGQVAKPKISGFVLQRAQWNNGMLNLAGAVEFKLGLSSAQRKVAINALAVKMRSHSGASIGPVWKLAVDANGNWVKSLSLPEGSVPCVIKLNFEGLNASSPVKLAPSSCVQ
jgi:hypothetical protein